MRSKNNLGTTFIGVVITEQHIMCYKIYELFIINADTNNITIE